MPEENSTDRRARRGYLILAGLLLAAVLIFNVDAVVDLARDHLELVTLVPSAEGVRIGSAVWVAGVESGRVTRVGFAGDVAPGPGQEDSTSVAVHVRLDPETAHVITRSSDVWAARVRFIAEPVIRIDPGPPGDTPVRDGDTLRGRVQPDPFDLLEQATALPAGLDSLVRSVRRIQSLAEGRAPDIQGLARQLTATTTAAAELSAGLSAGGGEGSLSRLLDPERGLATRVETLRQRLDELSAAAAIVARRYGPPGGDEGTADEVGLPTALRDLRLRADAVGQQLETLRTRLDRGEGFIPRMQQDSALVVAMRGVQAQIDSLTAEALSIGLRMLLP